MYLTRISTATVCLLTFATLALAAHTQPESAHDSHQIAGHATPDTFHFTGPDDLEDFFARADYTIDQWNAGDRSIPRFYLASVPSRWRHEVAPSLPVQLKKRYFFVVYALLVPVGTGAD